MGKPSTRGKTTLVGCSGNPMKYDINLHEGFTAIRAQENKATNNNKKHTQKREKKRGERATHAHIHTHTIIHAHIIMHYCNSNLL